MMFGGGSRLRIDAGPAGTRSGLVVWLDCGLTSIARVLEVGTCCTDP